MVLSTSEDVSHDIPFALASPVFQPTECNQNRGFVMNFTLCLPTSEMHDLISNTARELGTPQYNIQITNTKKNSFFAESNESGDRVFTPIQQPIPTTIQEISIHPTAPTEDDMYYSDTNSVNPEPWLDKYTTPERNEKLLHSDIRYNLSDVKNDNRKIQTKIVLASGAFSATLGLLCCGPVGAMILGSSAIYTAENKQNIFGDTARAVGESTLLVWEETLKFNRKHRIVVRTIQYGQGCYRRLKKYNREHKIIPRCQRFTQASFLSVVDYIQKHKLMERTVSSVRSLISFTVDHLAKVIVDASKLFSSN